MPSWRPISHSFIAMTGYRYLSGSGLELDFDVDADRQIEASARLPYAGFGSRMA